MNQNQLKFGLQPFWFWNGDMRPEEITRQIEEMHQKGIPGFFIHPRQGMEIPYLSQEYFDRVKLAVKTAKACGMEVWIYDEYPYPSGICGGEVILDHPEFLCKRLKRVVETVEGGQPVRLFAPWGKVLMARAYREKDGHIDLKEFMDLTAFVGTGYQQEVFQYSGLTQYNKKRYFTGDPGKLLCWTPPEGTWRIYFVTEVTMNHFKYFENFIDTLNPEVTRYFIKVTHERYKEQVGDEFGKTIKGFFSDEVTAFPDREPWSPLLPGKIKERFGIDFIDNLPAFWEDMGEISSRVRYAYWCTAADCFIESYDKAIYEWCEENHLLYVGEKPILRSKELQYMHIPGIDSGHQKVGSPARMVTERYRSNGKMISSAAHFYHKPAALCEAGHSIGWGMTIQDMKWIFDWLAVQGVDFYVIHGFFYTTDGLKKHDAPPSAFFQMPWWEDAGTLISYGKKLGDFLRSVKRQVKILAVDPVTSAWTSEQKEQALLKAGFARLQNAMLCQELDYYIVDPELLAQGQVVRRGEKTVLEIGGEGFEVLVLPPMRNLEQGACRKVLEFAGAGGNLCALSCVPFEKIEDSDLVKEVPCLFGINGKQAWESYIKGEKMEFRAAGNCYYGADVEGLIAWLKEKCPGGWEITPLDGLGREELPSVYGTDPDGRDVLFLVNTSLKERTLKVSSPSGEKGTVALAALESRVIRNLSEEERNMQQEDERILSLDTPMEIHLREKNALRLAEWTAVLPDGQKNRVTPSPVIDQLEEGGFLRPIRQKKYFGCPKELDFEEISVEYEMEFECQNELMEKVLPIWLVMEPETFVGQWHIEVNGQRFSKEEFVPKRFYLDTNLAADVSGALKDGVNRIRASVNTELSFGGMRNPLYLFGDFAVKRQGERWSLAPETEKGSMRDLVGAGLPFYYGEIAFVTDIPGGAPGSEPGSAPDSAVADVPGDTPGSAPVGAPADDPEGAPADAPVDAPVKIRFDAPWLTDSICLRIGTYETDPCSWSPYVFEVPGRLLKGSEVRLEILMKTTAAGLFEGQRFSMEKHQYEDIT